MAALAADLRYASWLLDQSWFASKYPHHHEWVSALVEDRPPPGPARSEPVQVLANSKLSAAQFELVQALEQLSAVDRQPPAKVVGGLDVPEVMLGLLAERLDAQRLRRQRIYRPTLWQLRNMVGSIDKVLGAFNSELTQIFTPKPAARPVLRRPTRTETKVVDPKPVLRRPQATSAPAQVSAPAEVSAPAPAVIPTVRVVLRRPGVPAPVISSGEGIDPPRPGMRCVIKIEGEWRLGRVTNVAGNEVEAELDLNGRLVVGSWHDRDFRQLD